MAWISLILAGICEMIGVGMINKWHHDRKWSSLLFLILGFGASFFFLSIAMETLPMGTAYAIWTGIGAVGAFVVGIAVLGEALTPMRVIGALLIVSGLVVLKLSSSQ